MTNKEAIEILYILKQEKMNNPVVIHQHKSSAITALDLAITTLQKLNPNQDR